MSALPRPLRGIVTPLVTPLLDPDTLDVQASMALAEEMIAAGVSGIFLLGTTGEAPGLSYRLRREFVGAICAAVEERVPVLVSISDTAITETLNFAHFAAANGASGLVLAPPYYFRLSQKELIGYLKRLAPQLPLPVYLYNIPSLTKTNFDVETVLAAAELPNVYGLKDSSGDMGYLAQVIAALAHRPDFSILCGPEELLVEALRMGAHGGITGGANISPRLYVDLYRATCNGDNHRVDQLRAIVNVISKGVYHASPDDSSYLRGMKCALSLQGRCRNILAEPYEPFGAAETEIIEKALSQCGLLNQVVAAGHNGLENRSVK